MANPGGQRPGRQLIGAFEGLMAQGRTHAPTHTRGESFREMERAWPTEARALRAYVQSRYPAELEHTGTAEAELADDVQWDVAQTVEWALEELAERVDALFPRGLRALVGYWEDHRERRLLAGYATRRTWDGHEMEYVRAHGLDRSTLPSTSDLSYTHNVPEVGRDVIGVRLAGALIHDMWRAVQGRIAGMPGAGAVTDAFRDLGNRVADINRGRAPGTDADAVVQVVDEAVQLYELVLAYLGARP